MAESRARGFFATLRMTVVKYSGINHGSPGPSRCCRPRSARLESKLRRNSGGCMKKLLSVALVAMLSLGASSAWAETNRSLPAGTAVKIKLENTLATFSSKQGDTFSGRVTEPVSLAGKTIIPIGATVQGTVGRVAEPRRIQGRPTIALFPHTVILPDGSRYSLNATVVDTSLG